MGVRAAHGRENNTWSAAWRGWARQGQARLGWARRAARQGKVAFQTEPGSYLTRLVLSQGATAVEVGLDAR
jgi:hypothetical protein